MNLPLSLTNGFAILIVTATIFSFLGFILPILTGGRSYAPPLLYRLCVRGVQFAVVDTCINSAIQKNRIGTSLMTSLIAIFVLGAVLDFFLFNVSRFKKEESRLLFKRGSQKPQGKAK